LTGARTKKEKDKGKRLLFKVKTPWQTLRFSATSADGPAKLPGVTENINNR